MSHVSQTDEFLAAAFGQPVQAPAVPRSTLGKAVRLAANVTAVVFFGAFSFPALVVGFITRMSLMGLVSGWDLGYTAYATLTSLVQDPFDEQLNQPAGDLIDQCIDDDHEIED